MLVQMQVLHEKRGTRGGPVGKAGPRLSFGGLLCRGFPRPHPPTPPAPPLPAVPGNGLLLLAPSSWARWQSRSIQQSNGLSETSRLPSDLSTGKHGAPTASPAGLRSPRAVLPSAFPPPALPVAAQTFHVAGSICKATAQTGAASLHACEPAPP